MLLLDMLPIVASSRSKGDCDESESSISLRCLYANNLETNQKTDIV